MDHLEEKLNTNLIAVQRVTEASLPLLDQGRQKKVINISSTMGSVAMKDIFAFAPTPSYKIGKAALNMLTVQQALTLGKDGYTCVAISPGWLRTEIGTDAAELSVETGAATVLRVIDGLTLEDSGSFRNIEVEGIESYQGGDIPW